jgi:hypothetical protein
LLVPVSAWAYRPFVSTDAAVAEPKEVEIEGGYFNLDRNRHENTISTPHTVLNYGVAKNVELVGEFTLQESPDVELTDLSLSVKAVLREGALQEKPGVQRRRRGRPVVAIDASPRTPRRVRGDRDRERQAGAGHGACERRRRSRPDRRTSASGVSSASCQFIQSFGSSRRSMARALRAHRRTTRRCSASSGSQRTRICFLTSAFATASAVLRPTGSSRWASRMVFPFRRSHDSSELVI